LCLTAWLLVGLLTAGPAGSASAQDQVGLVLSGLQTEAFPAVQFNLEAYDAQGNFIADLRPEELQLSEDGQPLSGQTLELVEPGLQFILALNPGAQLSTRIGRAGAAAAISACRPTPGCSSSTRENRRNGPAR
jgi:hypothetical protein